MTTQRSGFGQNSCAADEQACVFGSFEFNKHSVLKIFMINTLYKVCSVHRGDTMNTSGEYYEYIGGIS